MMWVWLAIFVAWAIGMVVILGVLRMGTRAQEDIVAYHAEDTMRYCFARHGTVRAETVVR